MLDLNEILSQPAGQVAGMAILLAVIGTIIGIAATVRIGATSKKFRELLKAPSGVNLEELLTEHMEERRDLQEHVRGLELRIVDLEAKMRTSKRHLGLVKYDAFEDVGGSQSFAMALYDDLGNGALVTSIVGRMDCRVYAKPLLKLSSERSLSQEEERAIKEATSEAPKTILS
jgi:hypothetical protein